MEWAGNPHVSYSLDGWIANAIILLYINMQCCPNQLCYFWSLGNKEAFCCWITYTWSLEYLGWNGKRNLMPVVPRNELDGFLLWVFCMLSNSKQMDNVVGEETALSTYILNNTRSFFFSPFTDSYCVLVVSLFISGFLNKMFLCEEVFLKVSLWISEENFGTNFYKEEPLLNPRLYARALYMVIIPSEFSFQSNTFTIKSWKMQRALVIMDFCPLDELV